MHKVHRVRSLTLLWVIVALLMTASVAPALARHDDERRPPATVAVQLLAINDLHGALDPARISTKVGGRAVGGAAVLAGWLDQRTAAADALGIETLRLGGGDLIGASQPVSALLKEEPTIEALNAMDLEASVVGNHEFDKGLAELRRLIGDDEHEDEDESDGTGATFAGARFSYLGANVVSSRTGRPVLTPYVVERVNGVRIGIIGVILRSAPSLIMPSATAGLTFLDEATTVNKYVHQLQHDGVHTFVVLLHQGGSGTVGGGPISGDVVPVVQAMDKDVDVVVSAHSHAGYQGMIDGKLVTEAWANGTAFADIELTIDRKSGDVVGKSATIQDTFRDAGGGLAPDAAVAQIVNDALAKVAPIINEVVGTASAAVSNTASAGGETPMGDLIADAQRAAMGTQMAFMNPGGVRNGTAGLPAGPWSWGALFTIQPFNNYVMAMKLTGQQIHDLLEQQWAGQPYARVLQISGLSYTWSVGGPLGDRVDPAAIFVGGIPLDLTAAYTVAANNYIASGGDLFSTFNLATDKVMGPVDIDALVAYVKALPQPFGAPAGGRILTTP